MDRANGFWQVDFKTLEDGYIPESGLIAGGVAVLVSGKLYGGDFFYLYQGTYQMDGNRLKGRVKVTPRSDLPDIGVLTAFLESRGSPFHVGVNLALQGDILLGSMELLDAEDRQTRQPTELLLRKLEGFSDS